MNKEQKIFFKFFSIVFLIISIIHVLYAAYVQRGLYLDGSLWFVDLLNSISQGSYHFPADSNHPRTMINFIQAFPTLILGNIFGCINKYILSFTYSLTHFVTPLLLLFGITDLPKEQKTKPFFSLHY